MILIIDNYDSFTYNLYQMVGECVSGDSRDNGDGPFCHVPLAGNMTKRTVPIVTEIQVIRNDAMSVDDVAALAPSHIILSPGPGHPRDAGICIDVIKQLAGTVPILGICLGHQAICEAYGATVTHARSLMHGKSSPVSIVADDPLFYGLGPEIQVGRYHSLAADPATIPDTLVVTAISDDDEIQAVRHKDFSVHGLQFHPESILTPQGARILDTFLGVGI
ncbi:MAG: aminodeoxychorismate/anthranilate synthase component II [Propionibacteriaceae bacterium]|nr:aminodeoxychorismate/anthranilate synthase component II [Propionibacteriaceae bacterium]